MNLCSLQIFQNKDNLNATNACLMSYVNFRVTAGSLNLYVIWDDCQFKLEISGNIKNCQMIFRPENSIQPKLLYMYLPFQSVCPIKNLK
jgi:hypothetical protein